MCRDKISILQLLLVTTYSTFAQDLASNKPANLTLSQNETKPDSTITWIKISTITPNSSTSTTEATLKNANINCTVTENISGENQSIDFASSLRRKRRKRRRNKYKAWNQRRPEHSHKKHSTKVEIIKPVQFLIPPEFEENFIPKEISYHKSRNNVAEKFADRTEKKIPPPVRHLLPPLVDIRFINSPTTVPVQQKPKKTKLVDWSPNSTNRGSTKFKHTVYYSDSGNEILSNYEDTSTTPKPQIKFPTNDDTRALTPARATTKTPKNYNNKLENRPIVVQPTPAQYHTTTPVPIHNHSTFFAGRETRINSLLSFEVANAGMQIINMTNFQKQNSPPPFQDQFVQNYKRFEPSASLKSTNSQQTPAQQSTAHPINYQQSQSQDRVPQQINYQQTQSEQSTNYRQSAQPQDEISYQQSQSQHLSNYQQSQSADRISAQNTYHRTPSPEQIPHQINYQQLTSQHQHKEIQNQQTRLPQPQVNYQQSLQAQPQPSQQSNHQQYQQAQLLPQPSGTVSNAQNFQQINHPPPYQTHNQQSLQNYTPQTTFSRQIEQRTTTPISDSAIARTTTPQKDKTDNFKGLDLAESKYFSEIPSEQEFNAVQNDGQVIPGIAGKDYPVFDQFLLQKRRFHCRGLEGYFADVTSRCQVFYICNGDGAGEPMLCPNGTLFSQELLVCDWWYNVDC